MVRHRNSIETWSKSGGEVFSGGTLNYDFTTAVTQAFGDNMVLVNGKYSFYTGDVNQDGVADVSDLSLIYNLQKSSGGSPVGYVPEDLNYDDFCDVTDISFCYNNLKLGVMEISPP